MPPYLLTLVLCLVIPATALAQNSSLSLSSAGAAAGGSLTLNLTLSGSAQPAGLQWTFNYSTADFTSMTVNAGLSATNAAKSLSCAGTNGSYTCILVGLNSNVIANGVVATATVTLSSSASTVRPIQLANVLGATAAGNAVVTTGGTGTVTVPDTLPPTAPTSLSATTVSGTQINLLWSGSTDNVAVNGYRIERCMGTTCTNFAQIGTSTALSYPDTALTAGTTYRYRVRASDAAANLSTYSAIATATTTVSVVISSLSCTPDTLTGAGQTSCTVSLSGSVAAGTSISLISSSTTINVPASLSIAAGQTSGTFSGTATATSSPQTVTITATYSGKSVSDTIQLVPPGVISIFPSTAIPSILSDSDTAAVELGLKFKSSVPGSVTGVRFYKGSQNTGTHTGSLWTSGGTRLAQVTFTNETNSGWQQMTFASPVSITANTVYVVSYNAPNGRYSANNGYFSQNGVDNGPLHALKEGESGSNGIYRYGSNVFPNASWQSSNYWVDVVFIPQSVTAPSPAISSLSCPSTVISGGSGNCTVALTAAALTGGAVISISDNNAVLTVPSSVTVASGNTTATFMITAGSVSASQAATVTATYSGVSKTAALTLLPSAQLSTLSCNPITLNSNQSGSCNVTLTQVAPTSGATVTVSSNNPFLSVPGTVVVPAGASASSFTASAGLLATIQSAIVSASYGGVAKTVTLTLGSSPQISGLSCSLSTVNSNQSSSCTVTLTGPALRGTTIALSSSDTLLTVSASIAVATGSTTGTFTATAGTITTDRTVSVRASLNDSSKTASITLKAPTILSIWPSSSTPAVVSTNDTAAVELGVKFRSSVAGNVVGVKFYKGAGNGGTHVGNVWSKSGALLARVTFTGETASGWQQANFATPVAISANTTYIVSYYAPQGRYSNNSRYFAGIAVTNGSLKALQDGEDGGNGVYAYGSSTRFPNSTYQSTNYWVDVIFSSQAGAQSLSTQLSTKQLIVSQSAEETSTAEVNVAAQRRTAETTASAPKRTRAVSCFPKMVVAGESFTCALQLNDRAVETQQVVVAASGTDARIPEHVTARSGQDRITFHGSIDHSAAQSAVVITVGEGQDQVQDQISVVSGYAPVFSLPPTMYASPGELVAFVADARAGTGLPLAVSAPAIPDGATFDAVSKRFTWIPLPGQEGDYAVAFTAKDSGGVTSQDKVRIIVDSGKPRVSVDSKFSCAPGSLTSLRGQWLTASDSAGSAGTIVRAEGEVLGIFMASQTQIDFLCPNRAPGTQSELTVETPRGVSVAVPIQIVEAKPWLLSVADGEMEGRVTLAGTDRLATIRDVRDVGEPVRGEDLVVIRATGLGKAPQIATTVLRIQGKEAPIEAILPDPEIPGVHQIHGRVPTIAGKGDAIPVELTVHLPGVQSLPSNIVTVAIE